MLQINTVKTLLIKNYTLIVATKVLTGTIQPKTTTLTVSFT